MSRTFPAPGSRAALALAVLALVVALGVPAEAARLINGKLLKRGSVAGSKLKNGAVTRAKLAVDAVDGSRVADGSLGGADIDEASLATVPSAANAATATNATNAANADHATAAGTAVTAATANNANNANTLGGIAAAGYLTASQVVRVSASLATGTVDLITNGPLKVTADCHAAAPTGFHIEAGTTTGGYVYSATFAVNTAPTTTSSDFERSVAGFDPVLQYGAAGLASSIQHASFLVRSTDGHVITGQLQVAVNGPSSGASCRISGVLIAG